MVNADRSIKRFSVAGRQFKSVEYANVLFFLKLCMSQSLTCYLAFSLYVYISNLKINYTKSEALNVTSTETLITIWDSYPFKWEPAVFKHLGDLANTPFNWNF